MNNKAVAFLRVSTNKQYQEGDSPEEQLESIQILVDKYKANLFNIFRFFESAGKKEQPLDKIYSYCLDNNIRYVFLKNIDRFTRAGARHYLRIFDKFKESGIDILDAEGVISHESKNTLDQYQVLYDWSKFRPSEEQELRKAQEAENERRRILTRVISAEIRYSRLGYWIGGINYGYKSVKENTPHGKRSILYPFEPEALFIKKMFELKDSGTKSDQEIVQVLNEAGYKSRKMKRWGKNGYFIGEKPLTVKQLYKYLRNPVFCLVRVMKRQRGRDDRGRLIYKQEEPVRVFGEQIISDELFNRVNEGHIQINELENGKIELLKGKIPHWQLFKNQHSEEFPYKKCILCPECNKPFMASAPKGKKGIRYPQYHCNRGHKWYSVKVDQMHKTITEFVKNIQLDDDTILRLKEAYARQFEDMRKTSMANTDIIQQEINEKLKRQEELIEKIEEYTSPVLIKRKEEEIDRLEIEIIRLRSARKKQEDTKTIAQDEIQKFWYFLEHLEELIINPVNSIRSAKFFKLLFDQTPTYTDLLLSKGSNPKLAWCFNLKRNTSLSVIRQGLFSNPNHIDYISRVLNTFRVTKYELSYA